MVKTVTLKLLISKDLMGKYLKVLDQISKILTGY